MPTPPASSLLKHLVSNKLCASFSEGRRLLNSGGLRINGEKTYDMAVEVFPGDEIKIGSGPVLIVTEPGI